MKANDPVDVAVESRVIFRSLGPSRIVPAPLAKSSLGDAIFELTDSLGFYKGSVQRW
jgi:hypothetical protein